MAAFAGAARMDGEEARIAVFDYLEAWYNPRRRHSSLDYASPLEFERKLEEVAIT